MTTHAKFDDGMRQLGVPALQPDGHFFLWITGRAMELVDEHRYTRSPGKLECLLDDGWGEESKQAPTTVDEENTQLMKELAPAYFNYIQRSEQDTITAKRNGLLTVETDLREIPVEMDDVKLTFIPERGDYVVLECMVQIDESYFDARGNILEVKKISPTRLVRGSGLVSKADERGGEIMTDND
ncbi:hypothetical protein pipiens_015736 [Culex pipiens pipiens]|uniref:Uncharacterized protein n=1 Tax=Culex pipiens pipiens TaxID=38569 RepID=A0ABD1CP69_CULPP